VDGLSFESSGPDAGIEAAAHLLSTKERILVFTGAGISTESGIPDFRGPDGVWTRVDPAEFTYSRFVENPDTRRHSWEMRRDSGILDADPNSAHFALVDLWATGRMLAVVTQNIDGLHRSAGLPDHAVVELHGNAHLTVCIECRVKVPTREVLSRVAAGDTDPSCLVCGGILKPDVVLFEEAMPVLETDRAMHLAYDADAVISIGSTLGVYPAALVPMRAVETGADLIIINQGATELDGLADVLIDGTAGEVIPALVTTITERDRI
jgi:NAD-dependent deacetylase